jgi:hypothetical protein
MIDLYYRPSDKVRDLSRNTVLFSSLTLFFSIYKIPITSFPFLTLNLDPKKAAEIFQNVSITSVLLIVSIFFLAQLYLLAFTEYGDWQRTKELALAKEALEGTISLEPKPDTKKLPSEAQEAYNNAQAALARLQRCNTTIGVARILFEFIFPAVLVLGGVLLEGGNLLAFMRVTLLSIII